MDHSYVDHNAMMRRVMDDNRWWQELSKQEQEKIEFKLQRALIQLIVSFPFFGFLAIKIAQHPVWIKSPDQLRKANNFRTMATDGKRLYMWPQYILYANQEIIVGTLIHELLHMVLLHIGRGEGYQKKLANIAMDYAVNMMVNDMARQQVGMPVRQQLSEEIFRKMPWYVGVPPAFYDERYRNKDGDPWTWEAIYDDLRQRQPDDVMDALQRGEEAELQGCDGTLLDDHDVWQSNGRPRGEDGKAFTDPVTNKDLKDQIREAYIQSKNMRKDVGRLPGNLERLVEEYLHPALPWQRLVANYLKPVDGWFGYQPGDLRFADPIPWFVPDNKLRYILISIDTSGSMSDEEVSKSIAEARHLLRGFPQTKGILCMCDADVHYWADLDEVYTLDRRSGGGGTSFYPPFDRALKEGIAKDIDLHIYFTDGYGTFPDHQYLVDAQIRFDTLWVITNSEVSAPSHPQYRMTRFNQEA